MGARKHHPPALFSQPVEQRLIALWNDGLPLDEILTQLKSEFNVAMSQVQARSVIAKTRRRSPKAVKSRQPNAVFVTERG